MEEEKQKKSNEGYHNGVVDMRKKKNSVSMIKKDKDKEKDCSIY